MASVQLDRLYLSAASDPTDVLVAFSGRDTADTRSRPVEVRTMANGRTRVVTRAGQSWTIGKTLRGLTLAQVQWLVDHRGVLVLLRDRDGRKVYGVYGEVTPTAYADLGGWDAAFTLTEVSYSEAV